MFKDKKGFTLIELLTVIAILGILVLIGAPKFLGYTEKATITQIKNDIAIFEKQAEVIELKEDNKALYSTKMSSENLQELNDFIVADKVYSKKGLVGSPMGGEIWIIDKNKIDSKSNLSGEFVIDSEGLVYHIRNGNLNQILEFEENGVTYRQVDLLRLDSIERFEATNTKASLTERDMYTLSFIDPAEATKSYNHYFFDGHIPASEAIKTTELYNTKRIVKEFYGGNPIIRQTQVTYTGKSTIVIRDFKPTNGVIRFQVIYNETAPLGNYAKDYGLSLDHFISDKRLAVNIYFNETSTQPYVSRNRSDYATIYSDAFIGKYTLNELYSNEIISNRITHANASGGAGSVKDHLAQEQLRTYITTGIPEGQIITVIVGKMGIDSERKGGAFPEFLVHGNEHLYSLAHMQMVSGQLIDITEELQSYYR